MHLSTFALYCSKRVNPLISKNYTYVHHTGSIEESLDLPPIIFFVSFIMPSFRIILS